MFLSMFLSCLKRYRLEVANYSMNSSAWILVFYSIIVGLTGEIGFSIPVIVFTKPVADHDNSCFHVRPGQILDSTHLFILQNSLFCILYPFTGWFSDIVIGRKKAVSLSLWLCWLGTLLQCISYCVQYGTCGLPVNIAKYGVSGVAFLLIMIGNAGLFTNIPAFGIDQLIDKPHTQSQAFLYWSVWGVFVGFLAAYIGFLPSSLDSFGLIQLTGVAIFFLSSLSVCLHSNLHHYFDNLYSSVQMNNNPYKLVFLVLKYAWHHKAPEHRSALTYWEDKLPSRINLGMSKYGGPFSVDEVEDVKAFLRMMLIFACTFGIFIPYYHTLLFGALSYIDEFEGATKSLAGFGPYAIWKSCDSSILIIVPLLYFIVIPLFPKVQYFMSNSLRGFIFCYLFTIVSLVFLIILEGVHALDQKSITFQYFAIPLVFSGFVGSLSLVFGLEFIFSQAPQTMKGMLTGLYWFIRVFYSDVGALFSYIPLHNGLLSTLWVFVIQLVISLVGFVCFVAAVRWYRGKKKSDDYDVHWNIEYAYSEYLRHNGSIEGEDNTTNEESLIN